MTVGIADWGIGGLGFCKALKNSRPDVEIVYLADQGYEMYDFLSREDLINRVGLLTQTFRDLGVKRVIMACDSASTVLNEIDTSGMKVTGIIAPVLRAMQQKHFREVGVIGERRTILSGAYGRALRKLRFMVVQRMSTDLALTIEAGREHTTATAEMIQELLEPICKIDCLLLASTQYSLVADAFQSILPAAEIVEPYREALRELLLELPAPEQTPRPSAFYTTGTPREMAIRAGQAFGMSIDVEAISIGDPGVALKSCQNSVNAHLL